MKLSQKRKEQAMRRFTKTYRRLGLPQKEIVEVAGVASATIWRVNNWTDKGGTYMAQDGIARKLEVFCKDFTEKKDKGADPENVSDKYGAAVPASNRTLRQGELPLEITVSNKPLDGTGTAPLTTIEKLSLLSSKMPRDTTLRAGELVDADTVQPEDTEIPHRTYLQRRNLNGEDRRIDIGSRYERYLKNDGEHDRRLEFRREGDELDDWQRDLKRVGAITGETKFPHQVELYDTETREAGALIMAIAKKRGVSVADLVKEANVKLHGSHKLCWEKLLDTREEVRVVRAELDVARGKLHKAELRDTGENEELKNNKDGAEWMKEKNAELETLQNKYNTLKACYDMEVQKIKELKAVINTLGKILRGDKI